VAPVERARLGAWLVTNGLNEAAGAHRGNRVAATALKKLLQTVYEAVAANGGVDRSGGDCLGDALGNVTLAAAAVPLAELLDHQRVERMSALVVAAPEDVYELIDAGSRAAVPAELSDDEEEPRVKRQPRTKRVKAEPKAEAEPRVKAEVKAEAKPRARQARVKAEAVEDDDDDDVIIDEPPKPKPTRSRAVKKEVPVEADSDSDDLEIVSVSRSRR
jgi:hypothetical protein